MAVGCQWSFINEGGLEEPSIFKEASIPKAIEQGYSKRLYRPIIGDGQNYLTNPLNLAKPGGFPEFGPYRGTWDPKFKRAFPPSLNLNLGLIKG